MDSRGAAVGAAAASQGELNFWFIVNNYDGILFPFDNKLYLFKDSVRETMSEEWMRRREKINFVCGCEQDVHVYNIRYCFFLHLLTAIYNKFPSRSLNLKYIFLYLIVKVSIEKKTYYTMLENSLDTHIQQIDHNLTAYSLVQLEYVFNHVQGNS